MANAKSLPPEVSERRKVEEEHRYFASIIESSEDAIIGKTLKDLIVSWNPGAEKVYGYTPDEVKGRPISILAQPGQEDESQKIIDRIKNGERVAHYKTVHVRKNGKRIHVSPTVSPIKDEKGRIIGASQISRNITAQVGAEEALHQKSSFVQLLKKVAFAANEAVNVEEGMRSVLEMICLQIGWPAAHVYLSEGDSPGELIAAPVWYPDGPNRFEALREAMEGARIILGEGVAGRVAASGESEWVADVARTNLFQETPSIREAGIKAAFAVPVLVKNEVAAVLEFFSLQPREPDLFLLEVLVQVGTQLGRLVERKRAEDVLKAYALELQRSNRELEEFASVASHDLQEPLRKIQAFGERLSERHGAALTEEGTDYLARMRDAAGRMQILINDLLAFSRVATKGQPFVQVDLNQIVMEVCSDLQFRIEQTGGTVDLEDLPTLEGDPLQMRQLFQNIIGNALKFHRPGSPPWVRICAKTAAKPKSTSGDKDRRCEILVEDNGIGFDEKYLDRIFTIFQRLHGRNEYEGTGIGLAICRRIVERHGGKLTAKSRPGEGTTFIITLPVKQTGKGKGS